MSTALEDVIATEAGRRALGLPIRFEVTLDIALFPLGTEVVGLGVNLEVGDTVLDIGSTKAGGWTMSNGFQFGKSPVTGDDVLSDAAGYGAGYAASEAGAYSGSNNGGLYGQLAADTYGAQYTRFPAVVRTAHELCIKPYSGTVPVGTGTLTLWVYVLPAAAGIVL